MQAVMLGGSFSPADIEAQVGLNKFQSEATARDFSDAGVLVLGFDCVAELSPAYRKANAPAPKGRKK